MRARRAVVASVLMLLGVGFADAAATGRGKGVSFPVSCSPAAQQSFNDALAALHSFWYAQAVKEFTAIADSEPTCAMAHWGVALSRWNQINGTYGQAALEPGPAAIKKAGASA